MFTSAMLQVLGITASYQQLFQYKQKVTAMTPSTQELTCIWIIKDRKHTVPKYFLRNKTVGEYHCRMHATEILCMTNRACHTILRAGILS